MIKRCCRRLLSVSRLSASQSSLKSVWRWGRLRCPLSFSAHMIGQQQPPSDTGHFSLMADVRVSVHSWPLSAEDASRSTDRGDADINTQHIQSWSIPELIRGQQCSSLLLSPRNSLIKSTGQINDESRVTTCHLRSGKLQLFCFDSCFCSDGNTFYCRWIDKYIYCIYSGMDG